MFPCFRVLIILYMNPWKSQVAQATLIHVCMENILHPKKCSLPDTLRRQSSAAAGTICTARAVWYRAQTGAARKASGRAWSALHLARPALLPVICGSPGVLGAGVSTGGVYSRRPAPPGQSFNHRKNKKGSKKGSKNHPTPLLPISKIFRKNKKTPTKGLCSVLYLPYKP